MMLLQSISGFIIFANEVSMGMQKKICIIF